MSNATSLTVLDSAGNPQTISTIDALLAVFGALGDAAAANGASGSAQAYLRAVKDALTSPASQAITIDQSTPGTTNGVVSTPVSSAYALNPAAQAPYRLRSSAASTNAANLKAVPGAVKWLIGTNNKAGVVYLELYNKATTPTVGTDTPYLTFALPASSTFAIDVASTGTKFPTGIGIGLHTVNTDGDATAVASGDITGLNVVFD